MAGLSQEQLADRAGLSVRGLRNLERGQSDCPHVGSLHRLADALALRGGARAEFFAVAGRRLIAATFELSYLPPGQQQFFRRLGLHPGTSTDAYAAALAGSPCRSLPGSLMPGTARAC